VLTMARIRRNLEFYPKKWSQFLPTLAQSLRARFQMQLSEPIIGTERARMAPPTDSQTQTIEPPTLAEVRAPETAFATLPHMPRGD